MYKENVQTQKELPWYQYSADHKAEIEESYNWIWNAIDVEIRKKGKQDFEALEKRIQLGEGKMAFSLLGSAKRLCRIVGIIREEKKEGCESSFEKCEDFSQCYALYLSALFQLRRMSFEISATGWETFNEFIRLNGVSPVAFYTIIAEEQIGYSREFISNITTSMVGVWNDKQTSTWEKLLGDLRRKKGEVSCFSKGEMAICVPTYNHPSLVRACLEKSADIYIKNNIDVYYLDSSETDDTKAIVEEYQKRGYKNLYYLRISVSKDGYGYEKYFMAFHQEGFNIHYKYVWPVKDRVFFGKETLFWVYKKIKERPDLLMLGLPKARNGYGDGINERYYDSAVQFYRDWAWLATSMDVIIYNADTILNNVGEDKYSNHSHKSVVAWPHIVTIFNEILEMNPLKIIVSIDNSRIPVNISSSESGWQKNLFSVVGKWARTNIELPKIYDPYKKSVIMDFASLGWIVGNRDRVYELINQEILTCESFSEVEEVWAFISDVPVEEIKERLKNKEVL